MSAKNVILRKKIDGVLYDLIPQTLFAQVVNTSGKNLDEIVTEINGAINGVDNRLTNIIKDAPEAYDTLKEISDYISTHGDEYTALQQLVGDKVTKVEGKGLSTNDFTNELKTKLDELYTKAQLDTKFNDVSANTTAIEKLNADENTEGSVKYMIKQAGGQTVQDVSTLKQDVATLKGDENTEGSVAKIVKDALDPITDETNGILATAKSYTDTNAGKVIVSDTQPANLGDNDLWIYCIPDTTPES